MNVNRVKIQQAQPPTALGARPAFQITRRHDLTDVWPAAEAGYLPVVSFRKAPGYQTGHPRYSDPLDEQGDVPTAPRGPQSRTGAHRHAAYLRSPRFAVPGEGTAKREGRAKEEASGICDKSHDRKAPARPAG
jgi:hypothetical protein